MLGKNYFSSLFKDDGSTPFLDQLHVIKHFPSFLSAQESTIMVAGVSMEEVDTALKSFKKDKHLSPDGWSMEFFLHFFEILGMEMVRAIEESRLIGVIPDDLNRTYLTLIPKVDRPMTFDDYRPISLHNCIYKIIPNFITRRIKGILSKEALEEQFSFLEDRQAHDVIGTTQEVLY